MDYITIIAAARDYRAAVAARREIDNAMHDMALDIAADLASITRYSKRRIAAVLLRIAHPATSTQ